MRFAAANGGRTIEMTAGGSALTFADRFIRPLSGSASDSLWRYASRHFANGSSGNVNVFLREGYNPIGAWAAVERPLLQQWGQQIITHPVP